MVRSADEIISVRELKLSEKTEHFYEVRFPNPADIVKVGRDLAFYGTKSKRGHELVDSLKDLGFIGQIEVSSFNVNKFYAEVFHWSDWVTENVFTEYAHIKTNEQYEQFVLFGEDYEAELREALRETLSYREYIVVKNFYGLPCMERDSIKKIAKELDMSVGYLNNLKRMIMRKLTLYRRDLPVIESANLNKKVDEAVREFPYVLKNEDVEAVVKMLGILREVSELPFTCSPKAIKCLDEFNL